MTHTTVGPEKMPNEPEVRAAPQIRHDPSDFDNLVREHGPRVTRLCYRLLGWNHDVEDVVQNVFCAALRAWPKFRRESLPATWLTRIAVNACRAHLRKRWLSLRFFDGGSEPPDLPDDRRPRDGLLSAECFERVRDAVRRLPAKYREVVVLRYLESLSGEQTAAALGVSRKAVDVRLNRARNMLRDELMELSDE